MIGWLIVIGYILANLLAVESFYRLALADEALAVWQRYQERP